MAPAVLIITARWTGLRRTIAVRSEQGRVDEPNRQQLKISYGM